MAPLTHGSIRQDVKERYQVMLSHLLQERSSVDDDDRDLHGYHVL